MSSESEEMDIYFQSWCIIFKSGFIKIVLNCWTCLDSGLIFIVIININNIGIGLFIVFGSLFLGYLAHMETIARLGHLHSGGRDAGIAWYAHRDILKCSLHNRSNPLWVKTYNQHPAMLHDHC